MIVLVKIELLTVDGESRTVNTDEDRTPSITGTVCRLTLISGGLPSIRNEANTHSSRIAISGSTLVARRAGT